MLKELFKRTNQLFWPVFKRGWVILMITSVGCETLHYYFTAVAKATQAQTGNLNVAAMLGELLVSLLEFVVLTMLIPQHVLEIEAREPSGSFWVFAKKHTQQLSLESVRALGVVILWSAMLVLPGLFKYIRYFLVPYIVVADPAYARGEVDALKESDRLIRGITLPFGIFVLILIGLDTWQSSLRESHPFLQEPLFAIGSTLVFFVLNYYANILLFVVYQLRKRLKDMGEVIK